MVAFVCLHITLSHYSCVSAYLPLFAMSVRICVLDLQIENMNLNYYSGIGHEKLYALHVLPCVYWHAASPPGIYFFVVVCLRNLHHHIVLVY